MLQYFYDSFFIFIFFIICIVKNIINVQNARDI